jgi:Ser/Thr protein kinase RdoA (MazF antagonist)
VSYDDLIRSALEAHWHRAPAQIVALPAGLMSRAWSVRSGEEDLVARLVDDDAGRPLEAGLAAAVHLEARGIAIGRPVRTLGGALTAETAAGTLALLRRVPGRPLHPNDPVDQQWWGDRLGAAHRELTGFGHPGLRRWSWLHPEAPHLSVEGWLRPAVADAVTAMTRLTVTDRLTYGVLHGDPAAEGFVVDPASGRAGLLDWGACGTGPLLYDVAAAVVYAGGPDAAAELLDGYLAAGPVGRDEADAALPVLLRFRWAVQADWYARRLAVVRAARTGAADGDPAPLRVPLQAARVALESMAG